MFEKKRMRTALLQQQPLELQELQAPLIFMLSSEIFSLF